MDADGEGASYSSSPQTDGEEASNPSSLRFPPPHRPFPEMILEAIDALKDDHLSNQSAILGYIKGKYGASLPPKHVSFVHSHLARMIRTGEVILNNNNYHRPAPPPVVANAVPVKRRPKRRRKPKFRAPEPFCGAWVTPSEAFVLGTFDANASKGYSPPPPFPHPPYPEMIVEALQALNNGNGSDSLAIAGYIEDKYGAKLTVGHRHPTFVRGNLSLMKASGEVLSVTPTPVRPPEDVEPVMETV